jgi:hypothetical protein
MSRICEYCQIEIKEKSYKAEGKRYHLNCVRKLRKKLERMKREGKIKPGQESEVDTGRNS